VLESEAAAVARLPDGGPARKTAARLRPGDGRDERIAKYERHPHDLLTSTLHERERLRTCHGGEHVPPPVADVNVTADEREVARVVGGRVSERPHFVGSL
jgi:hypothetical protein